MSDFDQAKTDLKSILTSIGRKFDIILVKWNDDKLFEAKFRTQIPRNNDDFNGLCDEWVDIFSNATNTIWVKKISNTGPKIRFRKQYQCWPHIGKEVQKELLFDARRCRGTVDIKVLTDTPLSRKKNKYIRSGLNVVVKINFTHLHLVDTTKHFAFFIHTCAPQLIPPKPVIQKTDTEKLTQKVAEIVQRGLNASTKSVTTKNEFRNISTETQTDVTAVQHPIEPFLQQNLFPVLRMESNEVNEILPTQENSDSKLNLPPQLQQLAQVVVATPPLDLNESLLMCQPTIMFDPTQIIPVTTQYVPHHFVQVHSHSLSNPHMHYL